MTNLRRMAAMTIAIGCFIVSGPLTVAQTAGAAPLPSVPGSGTFWLVQQPGPFPFDPLPDQPVYSLGGTSFLVDDSSVIYPPGTDETSAMSASSFSASSFQAGAAQPSGIGVGSGCGLWLDIAPTNSDFLLTLHNTRPGQTYDVWSIEDLTLTNWMLETNVLGATGDTTQTTITAGSRTNLFLRATEFRDYVTNTVFQGLSYSNTRVLVPDTMGAVGQSNFVELLNGTGTNTAFAVYDKAGTLISETSMTNFFAAVGSDGTNYPIGDMTDPRVLYDFQSQRWVASAIQHSGNIAILAVSNDQSPTNLATGWMKYVIPVSTTLGGIDYDTLGLDANGIYLSVVFGTNSGHLIVAIKKPDIYSGTNLSTQINVTNDLAYEAIQPAVNFDSVPTNGSAWFVLKGPPDEGTNYQGGPILYRRLQWQGTNPVLVDTNWVTLSTGGSNYQDYFDLDSTNTNSPAVAPALGGNIRIARFGSRPMMATIRNGFLWTCQAVGLSGTNGVYSGDSSGTNVDRSAVQWLQLQISADDTTLTLQNHGRFYDPAPTNAFWYYVPSLAINCAGDMVSGFSGSSPTNYIGAYYDWRLSSGATLTQPRVIQSGRTNYIDNAWGDYSATTSDPSDDWSFWTVQEYAASSVSFDPHWKTVIARIRPNP
jgi:hypothetical protein